MGVGQDLLGVQRLEVRAGCLDLLLQRLELALDALALGLGRGLDRSLERLLVGVEAFLGALLRGLGVGLELLDLFLNLGQHALRHIPRHQVALVDHRLLIAVEPDRHGPARLGADAGLDVLRRLLALGRQRVDGFLQLFLEACDLRVDLALQLLGLGLVLLAQLAALGVDVRPQANRALVLIHVEHGEHVLADFLVDVCDDVVREVEDLLEVARRHVEQQAHAARNALEVPDVAHRRGELDVAHALAAHLGAGHLDAALVADDALVAVALVLSAVAFPVPCRTEYALAEKTVALRAERAVVDGFRLRDLAVRPRHDRVGRCQRKLQRVKVLEFQQVLFPYLLLCRVLTKLLTLEADAQIERDLGDVFFTEYDLALVLAQDLDPERKPFQLLDQHAERLRDAGLERVVALDDRLVRLDASDDVVRLDGQDLLQDVSGAVSLERPHLHLAKPLAAELRLAAQRLLGDQAVRPGRPGVDLVLHQVGQLEHVDLADGHRLVELLTGPAVAQPDLAVHRKAGLLELGDDGLHRRSVEYGGRDLDAERAGHPAEVRLEHLAQVHAAGHAPRVEHDVDGRSVRHVRHVLRRHDPGDDALVAVAAGHLVARRDLSLLGDVHPDHLVDARAELVLVVPGEDFHVDHDSALAVRHAQAP